MALPEKKLEIFLEVYEIFSGYYFNKILQPFENCLSGGNNFPKARVLLFDNLNCFIVDGYKVNSAFKR